MSRRSGSVTALLFDKKKAANEIQSEPCGQKSNTQSAFLWVRSATAGEQDTLQWLQGQMQNPDSTVKEASCKRTTSETKLCRKLAFFLFINSLDTNMLRDVP